MNILIVFVINSSAITNNIGDVRYEILKKIAYNLSKNFNHNIFVKATNRNTILTTHIKNNYTIFNELKHKKLINLIITWSPPLVDYDSYHVPKIVYENGHMKNSIIIDPQGLLGKSFYRNTLNNLCELDYKKDKCEKWREYYLHQNSSKRIQSNIIDIPSDILGKYVFIPTQKHTDVSLADSKITMLNCLKRAAELCSREKIPLVIKIHPHLITKKKLWGAQFNLIKKLQNQYGNIFHSQASINYLMKNARFTMCLNGSTLMDNFINNTPVLTLADSMYQYTDAVVYRDNIIDGFNTMINNDYDYYKMMDKQKKIVWWYINNNLFLENSAEQNTNILNNHLKAFNPELSLLPSESLNKTLI